MLEFLKQWLMKPKTQKPVQPRMTEEELMARLKFIIGICLALTLFGIVFVVLYSLIFVTQPMNGMSPIDNKFFELIIPIATFLTGTLSGIMLSSTPKDEPKKPETPTAPAKPLVAAAPVVAPRPPTVPVVAAKPIVPGGDNI